MAFTALMTGGAEFKISFYGFDDGNTCPSIFFRSVLKYITVFLVNLIMVSYRF